MFNLTDKENPSAIQSSESTTSLQKQEPEKLVYNLVIYGLKKEISVKKLTRQFERLFGEIFDMKLTPYIDWNIAQVSCRSKETYERLLEFHEDDFAEVSNAFAICPSKSPFRLTVDACKMPQREPFTHLSYDCWRQVFVECTLKSQIELAKVSHNFHDIIADIWFSHYRNRFLYNLCEFEFKHELTVADVHDLVIVCGSFVEKIVFSTVLRFPLIRQHITVTKSLQQTKRFINSTFCSHLIHFCNVKEIEIQGKYLCDFTVREVARYCRDLRVLQLRDQDERFFTGKHVHMLSNLNVLSIENCENISSKTMLRICSSLQNLTTLNITDCLQLQDVSFIVEMCRRAPNLQILKMSTHENGDALKAILTLPRLKSLQMYWLNDNETFVRAFFPILVQHKRSDLLAISFETDRPNLGIPEKPYATPQKYELMRETVAVHAAEWRLDGKPTLATLLQFSALREIRFIYCRLLMPQDLLHLIEMHESLKIIKLIGRRAETDENLLKSLQVLKANGKAKRSEICIQGLISSSQIQTLERQNRSRNRRNEGNRLCVLRNVLCEFK